MKDQKKALGIKPKVNTIQEVIDQLEVIMDWATDHASALAYFPCLYHRVTVAVAEGIDQGAFEDGLRMEKLDVAFANRYFEALYQYVKGEEPTESWKVAFEASHLQSPLVMQHLLLGINAHINLDLGISAAEIMFPQTIDQLEEDFIRINRVLADLTQEVQKDLNRVSPALRILDALGGKKDEYLATFSLNKAREYAWAIALRYVKLTEEERRVAFPKIDQQAAGLSKMIYSPPKFIFRLAIMGVKWLEKKHPKKIIPYLRST